jgi:hypothetical protein
MEYGHGKMDFMPIAPSAPALPLFQTLSRSWALYRLTFLKAFFLALILSCIEFLPRIIVLLTGVDPFGIKPHVNYYRIFYILFDFIEIVIFAAILWHMQNVALARHESLAEDFRTGLKKLPAILVGAIVQIIIFVAISFTAVAIYFYMHLYQLSPAPDMLQIFVRSIPIILQFLLCVYLFFTLYFYLPLILTEKKNPITALIYSAKLVWGRWIETFWVIVTPWIFYLIVLLVFKYLGATIHIYTLPHSAEITPGGSLIHIVTFALFVPWFATTMLVQLRNLESYQAVVAVKVKRKKTSKRAKPTKKRSTRHK